MLLDKCTLKDLEYADDTLFSEAADQLSEAVSMFNEGNKKLGLKITQLMHVGNGPDPPPLLFDGTPLFTFSLPLRRTQKKELNCCHPLAALVLQSSWRRLP